LVPQLATYHIAFTTPYVLIDAMKKDWIDFLRRNIVGMKATSEAEALYRLLKFGPKKSYWNEFVLLADHHHQADAHKEHGVKSVAMSDGNMGCPHDEGEDFLDGEDSGWF
jgi:hypothetical protein